MSDKIKYVRMISIPKNGAQTITEISESEACAIRNNVFMRSGHVSIEDTGSGYRIQDDNGETLLTAVWEEQKQNEAKESEGV